MPQGAFDFTREVVYDLFGVQLSRQQCRQFARVAKKARSREDAHKRAERIDPKLGEAVKKTWRLPDWKEGLIILATIVTIMQGFPDAVANADAAVEWVKERLGEKQQRSDTPKESQDKNGSKDGDAEGHTGRDGAGSGERGWDDVIDT